MSLVHDRWPQKTVVIPSTTVLCGSCHSLQHIWQVRVTVSPLPGKAVSREAEPWGVGVGTEGTVGPWRWCWPSPRVQDWGLYLQTFVPPKNVLCNFSGKISMNSQLGRLDDTLKIASIWLSLWNLVVVIEGLSKCSSRNSPLSLFLLLWCLRHSWPVSCSSQPCARDIAGYG